MCAILDEYGRCACMARGASLVQCIAHLPAGLVPLLIVAHRILDTQRRASRASIQKRFHDIRVPKCGRPHQRSLSVAVLIINFGSAFQQEDNQVPSASTGCMAQGSDTRDILAVGRGATF
eukprot:3981005-Prymnesium_polylepis.1